MATFKRPIAGEAANLILSETFQGALVDVVNAYNRGELTKKPQDLRKQHVVMVKNQTAVTIEPGQALAVDQAMPAGGVPSASADMQVSYLHNPLVMGSAVVWHSNIGEFAVATQTIEAGQIGPAAFKPWGQVKADIGGVGDWLMHDPDAPEQFKLATGGIARVITFDTTTGQTVANFDEQQRLWRYELISDVDNLIGVAHLIDLGGNIYATANIRFTNSTKVAGDAGFCLHTGNDFDAIEAVATVGTEPTPRFRFRLKTDFDDTGVATAYVTDTFGAVTNPDGSPVALGDILTVHDPRKLFAHAIGADSLTGVQGTDPFFPAGGSVGYAVKTKQLKAYPSDPTDDQYPRWEVEQCTQIVDRMRVNIINHIDSQPTGELDETSGTPIKKRILYFDADEAILSRWPDVDYAPEWTPSGNPSWGFQIECMNPNRFSASDGWAIIERRVDRSRVEDATNVDTPYAANVAGLPEWHIVEVESMIARWIKVKWGGESTGFIYDTTSKAFAEGDDPSPALPALPYLFSDGSAIDDRIETAPGLAVDCLRVGEPGWAHWDPNEQKYYVIVTDSALYGAATDIYPVAEGTGATSPIGEFVDCSLTLRTLGPVKVFGSKPDCPAGQTDVAVPMDVTGIDVITSAGMSPGDPTQLCFQKTTVYVCSSIPGPAENCVDVCDPCEPGCCEYPPGTYTPGVSQADCIASGGTWTPGDCPEAGCYPCDFCDEGGLQYTLDGIQWDASVASGFAGRAVVDTAVWSAGASDCEATLTVEFETDEGLPNVSATAAVSLGMAGSIPACMGGLEIGLTWTPSTVFGVTLPTVMGQGFPSGCAGQYGFNNCGVLPTNPDFSGNWDLVCDISITECTP